MNSVLLLQQRLGLLFRQILCAWDESPASEAALQDVQATYDAFLLDPRAAFKSAPVPIFRLVAQFKRSLLASAAGAEGVNLTAAAELCELLLSIGQANCLTGRSIQEDRRQQRLLLDWPYSDAVPDNEPRPAEDQRRQYRAGMQHLARAVRAGGRGGGEDRPLETLLSLEALEAQLPGGQLAAVAEHPSLHFLAAWLAYKCGEQWDLREAVGWLSTAAVHPLLRTSCLLLRGLALFYLRHPAAQQELEGGLAQDEQEDAACRAEPALAVDALCALALLHAGSAGSDSAAAGVAEGGEEAQAEGGEAAAAALALAVESYGRAISLAEQHPEAMMCRLLLKATANLAPHLPDGRLVALYRAAMGSWDRLAPELQQDVQYHRQRAQRRLSGTAAEQELGPYDSAAIVEGAYHGRGDEPPVEVPELPAAGSYCQRCGARAGGLQRCARCQRFCYCGRACQVADWGTHKAVCRRG